MTPGEAIDRLELELGPDVPELIEPLRVLQRKVGFAEQARRELIQVLELDDDMSWDDVVTYAAKTRGSLRMCNRTVARRTEQLIAALELPDGATWPDIVIAASASVPARRSGSSGSR